MYKKFFSLFLALVLVTSVFVVTVIASQNQEFSEGRIPVREELTALDIAVDAEMDTIHGEGFSANHRKASDQVHLLYSGFMTNRLGDVMYPDFFGGQYFDDDGNLIILVVESGLERAYSHEAIGYLLGVGVNYRVVEFSNTELSEISDEIFDIVREKARNGCIYALNVSGVGTRVDIGAATIHLVEYNAHMIAGFRKYVYDSPLIVFEQLDRIIIEGASYSFCLDNDPDDYWLGNDDLFDSSYQEISPMVEIFVDPGDPVRTRVGIFPPRREEEASVGFRVRCIQTNFTGFMSAGHVFRQGDDVIRRSIVGSNLGVTHRSLFGGRMDAAVVRQIPNVVTTTNRLPNGQTLSAILATPILNQPVSMAGGTTRGIVNGQVTNPNFRFECPCCWTLLSNMVITNIPVRRGDSGGVVFTTSHRETSGLVVAGRNNMVFVPVHNIFQDFRTFGMHLQRW